MRPAPDKTFWITNFSDRNVTLSDLYLSIPAGASINLLDKKHYKFTEEQLQNSQTSGSIFKKQHLIAVRKVPPQMIPQYQITLNPHAVLPTRSMSSYEIKQEHYDELNIDEESELIEGQNKIEPSPIKRV